MNFLKISYLLNIILFFFLLLLIYANNFNRNLPNVIGNTISNSSVTASVLSSQSSNTTNVLPLGCQKYSNDDIELDIPCLDIKTTSPLIIEGKIRSNFVFEAQFKVHLLDKSGNVIDTVPAHATGDWTVDGLIPFETVITHSLTNQIGALIFENDNPSGLVENTRKIYIPILIQ